MMIEGGIFMLGALAFFAIVLWSDLSAIGDEEDER